MTLRTKTIGVTVLVLVILFALLSLAAQTIILDGFARLAQKEIIEDVERILNVLSAKSAVLVSTAADWATWDDTYQFVQGANADYVQSNLPDSIFSTLSCV